MEWVGGLKDWDSNFSAVYFGSLRFLPAVIAKPVVLIQIRVQCVSVAVLTSAPAISAQVLIVKVQFHTGTTEAVIAPMAACFTVAADAAAAVGAGIEFVRAGG
jgi:hypothetical protein